MARDCLNGNCETIFTKVKCGSCCVLGPKYTCRNRTSLWRSQTKIYQTPCLDQYITVNLN